MLTDGLTERQSEAQAVGTEVLDVSQMLLEAVKRGTGGPEGPAEPEHETDHEGDTDPATAATSANVGAGADGVERDGTAPDAVAPADGEGTPREGGTTPA